MDKAGITFIINGNTYHLNAGDGNAVRSIKKEDRQQLIALLESVRHHENLSKINVQRTADRLKAQTQNPATCSKSQIGNNDGPKPVAVENTGVESPYNSNRLSSAEVDDLMARLILEENQGKKPGLTKATVYKTIGFITLVIIILIVIF